MSYHDVKDSYGAEIAEIKAAGLWKTERVIASEQKNEITLEGGANVVNMCANNYLGLANNAEVMRAASDSLAPDFTASWTTWSTLIWLRA